MKKNPLFSSVSIIVGTAVGAGIFGIPYVAAKAGFFICLCYIIGIALITTMVNLGYGEVILRTKEKHQAPGYANKYLGKWGKIIVSASFVVGMYGGLIAYIIGVGRFLSVIFGNWLGLTPFVYSIIFLALASIAVYVGLGMIVWVEKFMVIFLGIVIIIFLVAGFPEIQIENLMTFNFAEIFLPFGVVMFALVGSSSLYDARRVMKGHEKKFKTAIILGVIIPAVLYVIFTFVVVGVAGLDTSQDAIEGLQGYLGNSVVMIGAILGTIAMTTSFLTLGLFLKEMFILDYKINKHLAWVYVISIPFFIFIINFVTFIEVLGITGAIIGGIGNIVIIMMFYKAKKMGNRKPEYTINIPKLVAYSLYIFFVIGIVYSIYDYLKLTY